MGDESEGNSFSVSFLFLNHDESIGNLGISNLELQDLGDVLIAECAMTGESATSFLGLVSKSKF